MLTIYNVNYLRISVVYLFKPYKFKQCLNLCKYGVHTVFIVTLINKFNNINICTLYV